MTADPAELGTKEDLYRRAKPASLRKRWAGAPVDIQTDWLDATVRKNIAYSITAIFGIANVITIVFIVWLAHQDQAALAASIIKPADRVVNNQVLMALLVQLPCNWVLLP